MTCSQHRKLPFIITNGLPGKLGITGRFDGAQTLFYQSKS
jgi:hypothetical protein